ncbi:MAG: hypothetical protein GY773_16305, partial [Actinomycetia bacterium]|nr:hypothetical protein [Actinomycetes bacterium]
QQVFSNRKRLADHRAKGKSSKVFTSDNIGAIGLWTWLGKKGAGLLGSALVNSLSFGLVDLEAGDVEGGRDTKFKWNFNGWASSFKQVKAQCAEVAATGMAGGAKATKIYTFLKMLSGWFLPLIRTICVGLGLWGVILALPTAGVSLAVASGAGTVGLVATGLKAIIELALLIWSAVRASQLDDKYARGSKVARSEATQHGVEFAIDTATFASGGLLGSRGGDMVSPDKVLESRFMETGTHKPSVQYGSLGYGDGGSIIQEGLDDGGLMAKTGTKGVAKGGVALGHQLGSSGSDDMYARDKRVKTGKTYDGGKASSATKKVSSGGDRLASKFGSVAGKVAKASSKASGKVSPDQASE